MSPTPAHLARYGLSREDYGALLDACGNRCPLCLKPFTASRRPCVDHSHKPPFRTRGLLCSPCNWLLGARSDDAGYYQAIVTYLCHPPAYRLPGPPRLHSDAEGLPATLK